MAAAAARAALVAMQKKKRKKEELIQNLVAKSNLTAEKRSTLYRTLMAGADTKCIAEISSEAFEAKRTSIHNAATVQPKPVIPKPSYISQRHYNYLHQYFLTPYEFGVRDKWLEAYISQSSDISIFKSSVKKITPLQGEKIEVKEKTEKMEIESSSTVPNNSNKNHEKLPSDFHWINEFILLNQIISTDKWFNGLIVFSIVAAGVLVGIQSYPEMESKALDVLDILVQLIFSLECVFKILAEGRHPIKYWSGAEWRWNNFDFWLVFLCWFPAGGNAAFLRLLRLMRLLKLVSKVKQLQVIVMGLLKGLSAVGYIILLMLLIFYLFAVMGVVSFRHNDPYHFGSLGVSMLSLFRAATLEDWADIMFINWFGCDSGYSGVLGVYDVEGDSYQFSSSAGNFPGLVCERSIAQPLISAFFFISFVLVAAFVTMALFIGAVCGGMYEALDDFKMQEEEEEKEKQAAEEDELQDSSKLFGIKAFRSVFDAVDSDCSGMIEEEELMHAIKMLGVETDINTVREIMAEVDTDNNGGLDFDEFVSVMTDGQGCEVEETDENTRQRGVEHRRGSFSKDVIHAKDHAKKVQEREAAHSQYLARHIRRAWKGEVNKRFEIKHADHWWRKMYFTCALQADNISSNDKFTDMITLTILAAGVVVGIQIEMDDSTPVLDALDALILTIFTFEVVVKIMAEGDEPWKYFDDNWNRFDFFIVFACFVFFLPFMPDVGSMLAMLRLLRLLRVLKLVKALPQLRIITVALISGFGSITFVTIMLFLLFYLFANICIIFFGENDPMHFGNLQLSLVSLFVIATLDDWTDIMYINMLGCDKYGYEFGSYSLGFEEKSKDNYLNCTKPNAMGWYATTIMVVFVVLGSFVMLNLFIGIVSTSMEQAKEDQINETKIHERLMLRTEQLKMGVKEVKLYQQVFWALNKRNNGKLDNRELKELVKCLPIVHFATALLDESKGPSEAPDQHVSFKVMNKRDIENFMQFIDQQYYGVIEFPEFLVLMDFMKRVDEMPSLLYNFRQAFEEALNDDSDDESDGGDAPHTNGTVPNSVATSANSSDEGDVPVVMVGRRSSKRGSYVIDEKVQTELKDLHNMNERLAKQLETAENDKKLMAMNLEASKRKVMMLEAEMEILRNPPTAPKSPNPSTPKLFSRMSRKLSSSRTLSGSSWVSNGNTVSGRMGSDKSLDEKDDSGLLKVTNELEKNPSEHETDGKEAVEWPTSMDDVRTRISTIGSQDGLED